MYKSKTTKRLLSLALSLVITFATQIPIFSIDVSDDFVAEPLVEFENIALSSASLSLTNFTGKLAIGQSYDFDASDNNITWSVIAGTGNAIIDTSTGIVTGVAHGTVKVVATHNVTLEYAYCTVYIIPIAEGRYFFQNSQYDNYMQIDDDSTLSADNAIMELWGYDGANHQRWNIYYLYNGYYKILCHASAKALTAPSSANGAVTQKTYDSNLLTQQWSITNVNGEWKLSPASNPTYYLAAGSSAYASDGRKVQMRSAQSDKKDEWILITN